MSAPKIVGQVTTTVTIKRVYDVHEGDWDFDYTEELPNEDDIVDLLTTRGPRSETEDVDWEFKVTND